MIEELWKDIKDYEGLYKISNIGRVRSVERYIQYKSSKGGEGKRLVKGKIKKYHITNKGYHTVNLSNNGKQKTFKVHRLIALAFIPNPNNLETVDHIDNNTDNNNIYNLQWMSRTDNTKKGKGRSKKVIIYKDTEKLQFENSILASKHIGCNKWSVSAVARGDENSIYGWSVMYV